MASYTTEQRRKLLSFLKSNPDSQFSAKQIAEELSEKSVSISSIYRNLATLEKEGLVTRTAVKGSRDSYFRYLDNDHCRECIHLTCLNCSKIFHLDSKIADSMTAALYNSSGFTVKRPDTVIYGVCKNCSV